MRKSIRVLLLSTMVAVSGCASMIQAACQRENAYASGMNDGREGKPMATYGIMCPAELQKDASAAYREGYQAGLASRAQPQFPRNEINIHIGH